MASVVYWLAALASPIIAATSLWPEIGERAALAARIIAALLAAVSLVCKAAGDHWSRKRQKSLEEAAADEERRISLALGDLATTLGQVAESADSRHREERSVEAAESVVVKLLEHRVREVRCCFYRLQATDELLRPKDDPTANLFLQRVGSARGRGVHQARETFTFADDDPDGNLTLSKILSDQPVHNLDTSPGVTGRHYGSFLSVPVHNRGKIVGMICVDSTDVRGVDIDCESLLRMVGALAALGLDADVLTVEQPPIRADAGRENSISFSDLIRALQPPEDEGEKR